jgi:hypothetical protein
VALDETTEALFTIGDMQEALAAAQKSLAIARSLAKDKTDTDAQRTLALSLDRIGGVKRRRRGARRLRGLAIRPTSPSAKAVG